MNEMRANEESVQVTNDNISTLPSSGFITVDLHEPEEDEKLTNEIQNRVPSRDIYKESKRSRRGPSSSKKSLDEESLIERDHHQSLSLPLPLSQNQAGATFIRNSPLEPANSAQELPNPCDLSQIAQPQEPRSNNSHDSLEIVVSPQTTRSPAPNLALKPPSMSASIFAFVMTVAFVCILWLVVFMVFGYRGHAIAGVFVGLFLVGLLLNTCFLKLYFRLKVFLGLSAAIAVAERQEAAMQRHRQIQEQIVFQKASERPPSYDNAVASPPPYNLLQYYKQRKSTTSLSSSASRASLYRKVHNCPFCKKEVKLFGMCISCKNNLSKK